MPAMPGGGPLVPLFRTPAPARGLIGVCDLFYADPHSLRLALCLRRRASGRVRDRLDYCGIHLVRVFQAALLLGLLDGWRILNRPRYLQVTGNEALLHISGKATSC